MHRFIVILLFIPFAAIADGNHSGLMCVSEVAHHVDKPGHEPIARCIATCKGYTVKFTGKEFAASRSYCPSYKGTWGIAYRQDLACVCAWDEDHCNADGSEVTVENETEENFCRQQFNGYYCSALGDKVVASYDSHTFKDGVHTMTRKYCGAIQQSQASSTSQSQDSPRSGSKKTVQYKIENHGTDSASCTQPGTASSNAVMITLAGEGFRFYVWPFDGWWFANLDPLGRGDRGPNHYGKHYANLEDADDLIAIGGNGVAMTLAGGLLGKMVCIVPEYNHEGPWKLTIE